MPSLVGILEQRRQGREQEMWSIPAISVAAQAFLFTTGLAADTKPAARIILGAIGLLTAIGTGLAILRQAARVHISEQWMQEIHGLPSVWDLRQQLVDRRSVPPPRQPRSLLDRTPPWILGPPDRFQISSGHVWGLVLASFAVADVLVILSAIRAVSLLNLGT